MVLRITGRTVGFVVVLVILILLALTTSAAGEAPFGAEKPLRIGVGGDYPDGLDGLLTSRGLPHDRVFPWELADAAVLKKYEVLLLSCPAATRGSLDPAFTDWIRAGGHAYIEAWPGQQGPYPLPEFVRLLGAAPEHSGVVLTGTDHPITHALDPHVVINIFHLTGNFIQATQSGEAAKVLARYSPDNGLTPYSWGGDAVLSMALGKGQLVYSGAPLSFILFHRGPTTEPLMVGILDYLCDGRDLPRLAPKAADEDVDRGGAGNLPARRSGPAIAGRVIPGPSLPTGSSVTAGLQLVEPAADGPYNVSARLGPGSGGDEREAVLLLDARFTPEGKTTGSYLRLTLNRSRVELHLVNDTGTTILAKASWLPPAGPMDLLVKRRGVLSEEPQGGEAGWKARGPLVVVALGDKELLRAKTDLPPGGAIAAAGGCFTLTEARYQPVEAPSFADDFMREPTDPNPWHTVSGQWQVVGLGNEKQSVNGFYFAGYGTETAVASAGEPWWDGYACGVALRLDGAGSGGLGVLRQENGDCLAFVADASRGPHAALRLVRRQGDKDTVLAQCPGGLDAGQWYRLTVRLEEDHLEAWLDGERVLECPLHEPRGGGIALLIRGGGARFDDVLVQPADEPVATPRHEGSPAADLPVSLGPQDALTWANPASAWTAMTDCPSLLWHTGDFARGVAASLQLEPTREPGWRRLILAPATLPAPMTATTPPEWLAVTATLLPSSGAVDLDLAAPGGKSTRARVNLGKGGTLSIERQDETTAVLWNRDVIARLGGTGALRRIGLEVGGPPVSVGSLSVRCPEVRDYVFGVAPCDWYASGGTWEVASRWACDSRWSWFAGWGDGDFAVWNKHRIDGDVAVDYYVGIKMRAPGGDEGSRCRDLNATLCGDKSNPRSGYSFIMGGDDGVKTQLLRNGVVVAEAPDLRVPGGYGVHHDWFHVRVARVGRRIEMDFEGRPVFRYDDPNPLAGGYVGLWSRDSGILIPRVTIYR